MLVPHSDGHSVKSARFDACSEVTPRKSSSIDKDAEEAFKIQQKFVADMLESVPLEARRKLAGLTS